MQANPQVDFRQIRIQGSDCFLSKNQVHDHLMTEHLCFIGNLLVVRRMHKCILLTCTHYIMKQSFMIVIYTRFARQSLLYHIAKFINTKILT